MKSFQPANSQSVSQSVAYLISQSVSVSGLIFQPQLWDSPGLIFPFLWSRGRKRWAGFEGDGLRSPVCCSIRVKWEGGNLCLPRTCPRILRVPVRDCWMIGVVVMCQSNQFIHQLFSVSYHKRGSQIQKLVPKRDV